MIEECTEVLARPKFGFEADEIRGLIEMLRKNGLLFAPPLSGVSPDPNDDAFIACALKANADFIVTGNKRHFPCASCGTAQVVNGREFLDMRGRVTPGPMGL
jgi:predicted nucleic acid-binding protein